MYTLTYTLSHTLYHIHSIFHCWNFKEKNRVIASLFYFIYSSCYVGYVTLGRCLCSLLYYSILYVNFYVTLLCYFIILLYFIAYTKGCDRVTKGWIGLYLLPIYRPVEEIEWLSGRCDDVDEHEKRLYMTLNVHAHNTLITRKTLISIYPSIHLSLYLSIYPSLIYPFIPLSIHLSIYPSLYPFINLSIFFP